jgi:hypothetical protein
MQKQAQSLDIEEIEPALMMACEGFEPQAPALSIL